ncbi:centrosomal protein of 290 kDa-like isoform X3 [Candoia aspera]|uniref:centrosomal protein of 290 kDa-like isoform X3 n=1 Tax=Candoia aspera TaxID=51853 RepID=UPI002FD7C99E
MFGLYSVWEAVEGKRMALPSVHRCLQLNQENQLLLKKLRHVRLKNKQLEYNVTQLQEKLQEQKRCLPACITKKEVLQMYNELKKRYNKEVKTNQRQNETVAMLSVKINDLEHQLQLADQKIKALEYKKRDKSVSIQRKMSSDKCLCKKKGSCSCKYLDQLLFETQRLKMENETLSRERRMLKNELAALDKDFFDEIEDLKYALQEAIKLNTHYEKCLKQLSSTYGVTFTSPLTAGNHRATLWK